MDFTIIDGAYVRHDFKTWVCEYPGMNNHNERFAAYRAVKPCSNGKPWTVDNRRIGFYPTLEQAINAAADWTE